MYKIIVKGRDLFNLKGVPVTGSTSLFVQGEIGIPYEFVFNTYSEHVELKTLTFKLFYKRKDGQGLAVNLGTPTINTDGTFSLTWTLDKHATYFNGAFVFCLAAYNGTTQIWKTASTAVSIAKTVTSEIVDPDEKTLTYDQIIGDMEDTIKSYFQAISGYDATKTQTLKNVNGTLTWVTES